MTTSWLPGAPVVPVAVKPAPATARAVTVRAAGLPGAGRAGAGARAGAGMGRALSVHDDPPSAEVAANGNRAPAEVIAVPVAASTVPFAATYRRAARTATAGRASVTCRQALPFGDTQAAGRFPAEPAATKPPLVAVTAASWVSPPVAETTAGCHPDSPAEDQA